MPEAVESFTASGFQGKDQGATQIMIDHESPAIQNSTQACFDCNGKLIDAKPPDVWEVYSGERFVKVKCANEKCGSTAWRPEQATPPKKT
jgi:hypothetical protein